MRSFQEIELKFGPASAYYCLLEIEKAALIRSSDVTDLDLEARFELACRTQDAMVAQSVCVAQDTMRPTASHAA